MQIWYVNIPFLSSEEQTEVYTKALMCEVELFDAAHSRTFLPDAVFIGGRGAALWICKGGLDSAGILNKKFSHAGAHVTVESCITEQQEIVLFQEKLMQLPYVQRIVYDPQWLWRLSGDELRTLLERLGHLCKQSAYAGKQVVLDLELGHWPVQDWKRLLDSIVQWPIDQLSIYFSEGEDLADQDLQAELFTASVAFLEQCGFRWQGRYDFVRGEPSVWCDAFAGRLPVRGFGAGAWSYQQGEYWGNAGTIQDYCAQLAAGRLPIVERYIEQRYELITKGLSHIRGIAFDEISQRVGEQQNLAERVEDLVRAGYLMRRENRLSFTPAGFLLENEVVIQLVNGRNI